MAKKKQQENQVNQEPYVETTVVDELLGGESAEEVEDEPEREAEAAGSGNVLEEVAAEAQKNWDLYVRERAELENFRKRAQREREDLHRYGNERLLREVIPVLDNLERAVEHAAQEEAEDTSLLEGVEMTLVQFRKALEDFGVKPVPSLGEPFDPNFHEAMGQVESDLPPNTVAVVYQKGYLLNDRLLRPSMVMVAKAAGEPAVEKPGPAIEDE